MDSVIEMHINAAAEGFSALGNETRIGIFHLLVQAGERGLTTRSIANEIAMPLSTLAHHLDTLTRARLVNQRKVGREVTNTANYPVLQTLIDYLTDKCCQGLPITALSKTLEESDKELIHS